MNIENPIVQEPPLTDEEIRQVRVMLAQLDEREKKTVTSSEHSFWKWIGRISGLIAIADKLRSLYWEQICILISSMFN